MKHVGLALVSAFGLLAAASPVPESVRRYINRRATVTAAEVSSLQFFAQYAGASYCNSEASTGTVVTCSDDVCPDVTAAGAKIVASFGGDITDIQGFVSSDDKNQLIVASIRGSSSIRNWISDLAFILVPCDLVSGCLAHAGFLTAYSEIADELLAALKSAKAAQPSYKIVFTGHSLGGAVSTIAAANARNAGFDVDLYTYGSPRVGNTAFVKFVSDQPGAEYRVTHVDDPVPRLPPIILDYRHTSPEYWLATGTANTTAYVASSIEVCPGYANVSCNAGTTGLDIDAHLNYFEPISGCGGSGLPFKRAELNVTSFMATTVVAEVSDADLLARLDDWAAKDRAYAASLDE
ncbi:alpha/beta-hydrolase [Jackrogersella minutella]|nr:alpha/beta-hydrolase [Jackrogersella minutella]